MGWWDSVIAELVPELTVVALDLSGHGDSGWRDDYSGDHWGHEVAAVATAAGSDSVLLVGHSLGGRVSILVAARHPQLVRDLILVEAPGRPQPGSEGRMRHPASRHTSLEQAVETFRLRPPEIVNNHAFLRRVATSSYREYDGHWGLKADRDVFRRIPEGVVTRHLAAATVPITAIHGHDSPVVTDEALKYLADTHPGATRFVSVPGGHHLLFDQGPAIADVIKSRWASLTQRTPTTDRLPDDTPRTWPDLPN